MNNKLKCCLCGTTTEDPLNLGEIKTCKGYSAHYYCLLLASTIKQSGKDNEGILGFLPTDISDELKRSKTRICSYCKKRGASVICNTKSCKIVFHLPCGIQNNSGHQFYGRFLSNCINHRPKQKYAKPKEPQSCPICYDFVNFNTWTDVLWAPCCKKNSYFHKNCLQQMALSAGYFFKCPICNNTDVFQRTMKHFGIFIPDRDASWELVPNAFQELLYRHDECNVKICLCTRGRKYSNYGPWSLVLCSTCGSQGTHVSCSKLKKDQLWYCLDCIPGPNKTQSSKNELPNNNNISASNQIISDIQPSTSRINNSDTTQNNPSSSQIINKRKRKRSFTEKKNDEKPSTSGTTSKSITETAIEIDSDSDVVVIEEDEPAFKCLVAQDGKVLPVRNISTNDKSFCIQGDLNISEKSKTDGLKNLVISDVRSLKEPSVRVQLDKQCDNMLNENRQMNNNPEMNNYVLYSSANNESRNSKNTVSVIDNQGNVYILKEILGFPIFSSNQMNQGQNNQNAGNYNNQQENEIVIID